MQTTTAPTPHQAQEQQYEDTPVDVKFKLSALWIAMLFVFAYVDIFALFRADVLEGLLDGEVVGVGLPVNQGFLIFTTLYILPACLMVYFSLTLSPKLNRRVNLIAASLYAVTIALSCIGETWMYYLIGSAVELFLLAIIARTARSWPLARNHNVVAAPISAQAFSPV